MALRSLFSLFLSGRLKTGFTLPITKDWSLYGTPIPKYTEKEASSDELPVVDVFRSLYLIRPYEELLIVTVQTLHQIGVKSAFDCRLSGVDLIVTAIGSIIILVRFLNGQWSEILAPSEVIVCFVCVERRLRNTNRITTLEQTIDKATKMVCVWGGGEGGGGGGLYHIIFYWPNLHPSFACCIKLLSSYQQFLDKK